MLKKKMISFIAAAALVLAVGGVAGAAPVTWDGSTDMTWSEPDATSWSGGTYNLGDDASFLGSGLGTVTIAGPGAVSPNSVTVDSAGDYTFVGSAITSPGKLHKVGTGTLVISSAGNSFSELEFDVGWDPAGNSGTVIIDDSVVASPSVTFTGWSKIDSGNCRNLLVIKNATVNMAGYRMSGGQLVVEGDSTVTITANEVDMGERDGRRASIYVKNSATIDGTGRTLAITSGWTQQTNYVRLQDTAQATFGEVNVLRTALYCDGHGHSGQLEVSDGAQLHSDDTGATGHMYVVRDVYDANRSGTIYAYAQVYQHGGTVTVDGNLLMGHSDREVGTGGATHKVQAAYNLWNGGTDNILNVGGRILGGADRTGYGQSYFNFHGGTLAYTGAGDQTDWIDLTVTAGTAGTTSVNNLRLWEGGTIDVPSDKSVTINQAILAPTGQGISAIDPAGLGDPAAVYDYGTPPWVYIDGGGGSGGTAVAQLDAGGVVTSIDVTNPGNNYTSAPTVRLVRNGVGDNNVAAGSITLSDNSSYTGGLIKEGGGTLTLTAANTYTGDTTVNTGTLALATGAGTTNPIGSSPIIDVAAGATFDVSGVTDGFTLASGQTLMGNGTVNGAVTAGAGSTVAPGASIGELSVTGNVELAAGASYPVEVSGSAAGGALVAGTNNDSLAVTGDVTVGAMGLDLVWLVGDKIGGDGDGKFGGEYTIVTGTTVSGSPANVTVNSFVAKFPDGSTVDLWNSYYHDVTGPSGPSDVLVSVGPADPFTDKVTVTLPQVLRGDSSLDGRVMMNDALPIILNWQKDVVPGTGWEIGNFNFDNKIMMNDALEIILSWGQQTDADPPGPNPAGAVEAAAVEDRATAVYDAATGYIWLEVNAPLAYLQIIDPTGTGQLGPKDPDGTKPFVGFHPLDPLNLLEDQRPHHVGEMNFGGLPQTAGPHMYVEAVPGILEEDFDLDLYTAALDWTDATVDVVWTPEPATMSLLLLGGAVVLARRRRRK